MVLGVTFVHFVLLYYIMQMRMADETTWRDCVYSWTLCLTTVLMTIDCCTLVKYLSVMLQVSLEA